MAAWSGLDAPRLPTETTSSGSTTIADISNYIRPHEASRMQTRQPLAAARPSTTPPARLGVPEGAWTLKKIDSHGTIDIKEQSYRIPRRWSAKRAYVEAEVKIP